ncbi:MAG TPA: hypothetical protein VMZ92_20870 [Planctomycetota bacterium]|nr:hypothetical protein [Planctomycetota bacterium]
MRHPVCRWVTSALVLLVLSGGPAGDGGEPPVDPVREPTAVELKRQVIDLAARGALTDTLIARYKDYAWRRAIENLGDDVPEAFWTWASANPTLRDGLILALHPDDNPHVVKRLWELKQHFGDRVDEYAHLALAFAVVFGQARDSDPWSDRPRVKEYLRSDRKPPGMTESFAYYLEHREEMRYPLRTTPWLLLVHVADNETPIEERRWVLRNYAKVPDLRLAGVHQEVPWKMEKLEGKWSIGDRPRTLENLKEYGGVCAEQAYFASRVHKSLGIPAMENSGGSWRGYHCWVSWIVRRNRRSAAEEEGYLLFHAAGTGGEEYFSSRTYLPAARRTAPTSEVELLVAAMRHSYQRYVEARLGCMVYEMFEGETRKDRTRLLKDSAGRNPYCGRAWRLLAQACVDGLLSEKEAEEVVDTMIGALEGSPALTFEVLEKVLSPRLTTAGHVPQDLIRRNLGVLNRALVLYDRLQRSDLAIQLVLVKGSYLVGLGREEAARKLYMLACEKYVNRHTRVAVLFDHALALMKQDTQRKQRLRFVGALANKVRRPDFCGPGADVYTHVIETYIEELRAAGRDDLADEWNAKLKEDPPRG